MCAASACASATNCDINATGANVIVSNCRDGDLCDATYDENPHGVLPALPDSTERLLCDVADTCGFDGVVTFAGPLSLRASERWYAIATELRQALQLFADLVNKERGGLTVRGRRLALRLRWVGDGSSLEQVSNATAHASRGEDGSQFLLGPYSSSLTRYAIQQADTDGKIMVSSAAATTSVISQSNLSFGTLPPASQYMRAIAGAVAAAAEACDRLEDEDEDEEVSPAHPCSAGQREVRCAAGGGSCRASLRAGFVHERTTFTRAMCAAGPAELEALGVAAATDERTGGALSTSVGTLDGAVQLDQLEVADPRYRAYVDDVVEALRPHQAANVTLLIGCTYFASARALVEALDRLQYAPLAVSVGGLFVDSRYTGLVDAGWREAHYLIEHSIWHPSVDGVRGAFSNLTSTEFAARFSERFVGVDVHFLGAAAFAAGVALAAAIEAAGSTETAAVAAALRAMDLPEFYGRIRFDEHGQMIHTPLVVQLRPGETRDRVVYDPVDGNVDAMAFPMPTCAPSAAP